MERAVETAFIRAFHSKLSRLQLDDTVCDITIHVGEKSFRCHRVVLIAASEYFDVMLNGHFNEYSSREVTLEEIDADVFEVILKFIYTGKADVDSSNLYAILRAADLYQLPHLVELCFIFGRENLNTVADDILKIFWFAHRAGMNERANFFKRHIYENFSYFFKVPEFVELSVDILLEVLEVGPKDGVVHLPQDVFFEGIYTWITHQENLNPDQRKLHFDRLCEKIDLRRLSDQYTKERLPKCMAALASSGESIDSSIAVAVVVPSCPKLLRAYVSTVHKVIPSRRTSMFTGFSSASPSTWMYSGRVKNWFANYMDNTVVDDLLYSLSYERGARGKRHQQTFTYSPSALMYPYTPLKRPPLLVEEFDMAGTANEIFLYNKNVYSGPTADSLFSEEELSRGLFLYKRDIDQWFALPPSKVKVSLASMTCDDRRLYLIGGSTDNTDRISNLIQGYDLRTQEWCELPPAKYNYWSAASCIYGKEIFVVGNRLSPGEIYDPTSGSSRLLTGGCNPYCYRTRKLLNWSGTIVSYDSHNFEISCYSDTSDRRPWISLPDLKQEVVAASPYEYGFLHMVSY